LFYSYYNLFGHLISVFPTQVFPNRKPVFFGYFLLPETRLFSTTKPGYF